MRQPLDEAESRQPILRPKTSSTYLSNVGGGLHNETPELQKPSHPRSPAEVRPTATQLRLSKKGPTSERPQVGTFPQVHILASCVGQSSSTQNRHHPDPSASMERNNEEMATPLMLKVTISKDNTTPSKEQGLLLGMCLPRRGSKYPRFEFTNGCAV